MIKTRSFIDDSGEKREYVGWHLIYSQRSGINFNETFGAVVRISLVIIVIAYAIENSNLLHVFKEKLEDICRYEEKYIAIKAAELRTGKRMCRL